MSFPLSRRQFLQTSASAAAAFAFRPTTTHASARESFSFVLLGDLHFDKLEHHDMAWLEKNKAGDLRQITNYSRITADITPRLFAAVRESVAETNSAFVLQVGDLVEGICGTEELAARQDAEALAFVREAGFGVPFVLTKGKHHVTGDGATDAFRHFCHPFLSEQTAAFTGGGKLSAANYTVEHGGALFCFFDAYDPQSLDWLEAALARRTARHCFVVVHPPVVPYGARATWHLYSSAKDQSKRERLLVLLGRQNAFVLGGHIHKFNALTRATAGGGKFVQLAVSSIVNAPEVKAKDLLVGTSAYNGDQVRIEPAFSPETEKARRAVYDAESPFVKAFEYADLPGHAVVTVAGSEVKADLYSGVSRQLWKTVNLSGLMSA
jgi:hypothetical protein